MDSAMGRTSGDMRLRGAERSQSEVVGVVLVLGMVIAGAFAVVALGATAINDTEDRLSADRAEKTLTQLDSKAGLVALGETNSQQVQLPSGAGEDFTVNENEGWMKVTVENRTHPSNPTWGQPLVNVSLGSLTYSQGESRLAYQGGGVFRAGDTNATMVSPPEFHYRNGTLTLPIVNITGDRSLGPSATINHADENQVFPRADALNPLDNHKVSVTVQSEYYEGWGQYFEQRTDGGVEYDHDANEVTLVLVTEANHSPLEGGLITGADTLVINNNAEVDSYNSSEGEYAETGSGQPYDDDSKVIAAGTIQIENNAEIHGDVEAGGDVILNNQGVINEGNISHDGEFIWDGTWDPGPPQYWVNDNGTAEPLDGVGILIDDWIEQLSEDNDNDETSNVTNNELTNCNPSCTLSSGEYYLEYLQLINNENLNLDTADGPIEIAVNGSIDVANGQMIEVMNNDRVNIYVDDDVTFENNAEVLVPGDNSSQFWMYLRPEALATMENNVIFKGVAFGPSSNGLGADIELNENVRVFGGVVGDIDFAANNVWIHFDERLASVEPVEDGTKTISITYLHITENEIRIE